MQNVCIGPHTPAVCLVPKSLVHLAFPNLAHGPACMHKHVCKLTHKHVLTFVYACMYEHGAHMHVDKQTLCAP
jgi:hypothetical protein